MSAEPTLVVDLALSRRLERAEAHANARFVESRARLVPSVGACWTDVGGTYAMFDGVGSPLTQTFGLGLFEPVTPWMLDAIESFFRERQAEVFHEVSPLAGADTLTVLNARGYQPCELTTVLFQPLEFSARPAPDTPFIVRTVAVEEREVWARTAFDGWSEFPEVREFMAAFGPTAAGAEDAYPFIALEGEVPIASGSLSLHGGVALLSGASTIPGARGRGAQRALLAARLRFAAEQGCSLAMMCAAPGSASQRNAERSGFRIAYTRTKWRGR
ncbi:MAG: GNAT family N-acetyltransferase [Acidobacteria bacterium]|nr:GNAT family N-acetyltransferase [Acidobacteriota bacterium]